MRIDPRLIEREHIRSKLEALRLLGLISPYRDTVETFDQRILRSLKEFPAEYGEAALLIFANTVYLPKRMMEDGWSSVWSRFCDSHKSAPDLSDLLFLEVDRDALIDDFHRVASIPGRLDQGTQVRSIADLAHLVMLLADSHEDKTQEIARSLGDAFRRSKWILLTDLSISGGTVFYHLRVLKSIIALVDPAREPEVLVFAQVISEVALQKLWNDATILHGICIPRSCALADPSYSLVSDQALVGRMRELCHWFADEHVQSPSRLVDLARGDPDVMRYGLGRMGWPIVTHKNTPDNSIPLMWYKPSDHGYQPPFQRLDSRTRWSSDELYRRVENLDQECQGRIKAGVESMRWRWQNVQGS